MKSGIHPEYETAKITCACGRATETRTTVGEIHVEICSHCHPFFTGRQKLVDTAGRVERFRAKYGTAAVAPAAAEAKVQEVEEIVADDGVAAAAEEPAEEETAAEEVTDAVAEEVSDDAAEEEEEEKESV